MSCRVQEREAFILKYLAENSSASVLELSSLCDVSEVTIRRDLIKLRKNNLVSRFHGGASIEGAAPGGSRAMESPFQEKVDRMRAEKQAIGAKACEYVKDYDTIFINSGTTVLQFLSALHDQHKKGITVVTNNTEALGLIREGMDMDILLTGGFYHPRSRAVGGEMTVSSLEGVYSGCTILGVNALDLEAGMTTDAFHESLTNAKMIKNTRGKVILLADSSKMGKVAHYQSASLSQIQVIITDTNCPAQFVDALRKMGIEVVTVSPLY